MQRNVLSLVGVFLAGLLVGWLALGWWLWPVAYVGEAYTYELNQTDKLRYTQGAVDAFTLTGQVDPDWFAQWTPEEVSQTLAQVADQPNRQAAAYSLGMKLGVAVQAKVVQAPTPVPLTAKLSKAQVSESAPFDWGIPLGVCGGVVVSVLVAGGGESSSSLAGIASLDLANPRTPARATLSNKQLTTLLSPRKSPPWPTLG